MDELLADKKVLEKEAVPKVKKVNYLNPLTRGLI